MAEESKAQDSGKAGESIGHILGIVKDSPLWLLAGLAIAAIGFLYLGNINNIPPTYLLIVELAAWGFTVLSVTRFISLLIEQHKQRHKKTLNIIADAAQSFWAQSRQPDGRTFTQITLRLKVTNLRDEATRLPEARLIKPSVKAQNIHTFVSVEQPVGGKVHSQEHCIFPRAIQAATVNFTISRPVGKVGKPLNIKAVISDQFGQENQFYATLKDIHAHS